MRQIKFRGLTESGQWVYGYFVQGFDFQYIMAEVSELKRDLFKVIPSTVGQFTGLLDKNGKEIYEGDLISSTFGDGTAGKILFGEYYEDEEYPAASAVGFYWKDIDGDEYRFGKSIDGSTDAYEIIGNIHENPELEKSEVV